MSNVAVDIGLLAVGIINVLSCYIAGFITYRYGKKLNVSSSIPWCLLQISYGTMPIFGLWEELVGDHWYMHSFSRFFSIMTMMFLTSATIIDSKICSIKWSIKHVLLYILVIIPFWVILLFVPELSDIADEIFPICILPFAVLGFSLMIYYLITLHVLCGIAGFVLFLSVLMNIFGFMSRIIFDEESAAKDYGWYIFSWLAVIFLFVLWCLIHIYKKLDNDTDNDKSGIESALSDDEQNAIISSQI